MIVCFPWPRGSPRHLCSLPVHAFLCFETTKVLFYNWALYWAPPPLLVVGTLKYPFLFKMIPISFQETKEDIKYIIFLTFFKYFKMLIPCLRGRGRRWSPPSSSRQPLCTESIYSNCILLPLKVTGVSQKRYFRRKGLPNLYLVIDW